MSDIDLFSDSGSPFDAVRQVRADGTEFWSARDLMPLMGTLKITPQGAEAIARLIAKAVAA